LIRVGHGPLPGHTLGRCPGQNKFFLQIKAVVIGNVALGLCRHAPPGLLKGVPVKAIVGLLPAIEGFINLVNPLHHGINGFLSPLFLQRRNGNVISLQLRNAVFAPFDLREEIIKEPVEPLAFLLGRVSPVLPVKHDFDRTGRHKLGVHQIGVRALQLVRNIGLERSGKHLLRLRVVFSALTMVE